MKKNLKYIFLTILIITLTGCFSKDKLSNDNVYTTIYPINYLTSYLYGDIKNVSSIYPAGADVTTYELTKKKKETYEKGALFVYNGLTNEKSLAKEFINNNKDMLLIDVSQGLNYEYAIEELWLSPNNYLMFAKNIKNYLIEYTTSKTVIDSIEKNYRELEEKLSFMDAELRDIASTAVFDGNYTLVVSSSKLRFLEKYGFEVIVLDSKELNTTSIKSNFKNSKYKDIYLCNTDPKTDLIKQLESEYKANIITVNTLTTLSDNEVQNNEDYLTIMTSLIDNIRNTALS